MISQLDKARWIEEILMSTRRLTDSEGRHVYLSLADVDELLSATIAANRVMAPTLSAQFRQ